MSKQCYYQDTQEVIPMTMGDRIKQLREKNGMTQEELGEYLGVQKSAIRKYEKGSVENIKRTSIKKMADLFKVSPAYLMCFDEPKEEASTSLTEEQQNALDLYSQLDPIDRAEIRGMMKQMLRAEKYAGEKANLA